MVCNKDFNLLPLRELDDKQDFYIRLSTLLAGFGDKGVSQLPFLPMIGYTEPYGFWLPPDYCL